jgi:methionyl-tRNA formyltransferase
MRVVFMGSADVSCVMLEALLRASGCEVVGVVTQPDRPSGRNRQWTPCPAKRLAVEAGLPVATPEKINAPESLAQVEAWTPDVVVVVAYGQFLGRRLLDLPRHGCVNIHLSLLPRHRGAAPVQGAIASGDSETGVTAIRMDPGMDSGDILGQSREAILPDDTAWSLSERLASAGARLLVQTLRDLAGGCAVRTPQDAARATFAPKLRKEDGVIDWTQPAVVIERRVRAFNPWPGSSAGLPARIPAGSGGGRIKLHRVEAVSAVPVGAPAVPGVVLDCRDGGVLVQTGEGALRLLVVQPEGGKPMDAQAFLCGHPLQAGVRFE